MLKRKQISLINITFTTENKASKRSKSNSKHIKKKQKKQQQQLVNGVMLKGFFSLNNEAAFMINQSPHDSLDPFFNNQFIKL